MKRTKKNQLKRNRGWFARKARDSIFGFVLGVTFLYAMFCGLEMGLENQAERLAKAEAKQVIGDIKASEVE